MLNFDDASYKAVMDCISDGIYYIDTNRRIKYWNKAAERITGYKRSDVIGKRCCDNILQHMDEKGTNFCVGKCLLKEALNKNGTSKQEVYLHNKGGHRVPVIVRIIPVRNASGEITGAIEVVRESTSSQKLIERLEVLEEMAFLDPLTRLANRRYIEEGLRAKLNEFERFGWQFGVFLADIDDFKRINDTYGHEMGDRVLKMVANTFIHCSRPFDIIGRWGGEEFFAILGNVNKKQLFAIADRFRLLVKGSLLPADANQQIGVTISIGAAIAHLGDTPETIFKRSDTLLYNSKNSGKDKLSME